MTTTADRPLSTVGAMVMSLGQSLANVSKVAYEQGRAAGLAEGECALELRCQGNLKLQGRIDALKAALEECLEYFEDRYDTVDGDEGQPRANREMQLGQMIEAALGRRP